MSSKSLYLWVRIAVLAVAMCGIFLLGYVIPVWGDDMVAAEGVVSNYRWAWTIFLWLVGIPCFFVLGYVWKFSGAIRREAVFTNVTAKWVRRSALLLFEAVGLFFAGNILLFILDMSHPGILLLSIIIDVLGIAVASGVAILSRYMLRAAELQEVSDGMI